MRTRDYIEQGEAEGKTLLDAMKDGELDGMQHFDGEIEKLVRAGVISYATGLLYATNAGNLQIQLADVPADGRRVGDCQISTPGEARPTFSTPRLCRALARLSWSSSRRARANGFWTSVAVRVR